MARVGHLTAISCTACPSVLAGARPGATSWPGTAGPHQAPAWVPGAGVNPPFPCPRPARRRPIPPDSFLTRSDHPSLSLARN